MTPSKQQQDIYEWVKTGNGNLIIKARAGSGKTTTAVNAIQFMKGTVLAMAFNTKASYQLQEKLKTMACPNATASTVHSAGKGMLYKALGWHKVNASKVYFMTEKYCQSEELRVTRNFITKLVGFAKQSAFGVKGQISIEDTQAWVDIIAHHDIDMNFDADLHTVIEIAKDVLNDSNRDVKSIDFDDMQYLPLVYDVDPQTKYDWVIIDEAQDTNVCRKLLLKKLLKNSGRLIAIGDEGQAIYGFTGAENDSMNLIKDMFNCSELPLSICYRCGTSIITEAQKYFPDIMAYENAPTGSITSQKYQEFVDSAITMKFSRNDGIICRNNAPNVALAFALIRQGIGCRIEGKDIGNDLKKLVNKWKRVSNLEEFTNKLLDFFNKEFNKANYAKLQLLEDKMDTMIILIERCQSLGQNDLKSLEDLITSMFTDTKDGNVPDIVTFSSIHKAKGLEWNRVFWVGDAQFSPSKYAVQAWQVEQENNLRYVACTRAMNELIHLTDCPARRGANEE
jgi:DNA helicase-2/ATP-dependent DNA helicase PcrA